MKSADAVERLEKIARKFAEEYLNVEHLTIKVHRGIGGGDYYVEEEWDWKG